MGHNYVFLFLIYNDNIPPNYTPQKPNHCFSQQLGYCSCVTILPMLIHRMQYLLIIQWDTGLL